MRHLRNIAYPAIFIAFATQSCNNGQSTKTNTTDSPAVKTTIAPSSETSAPESNKINNDNLTGFMLGGVYFINGFGGVYNTYSNAVDYYDATVAEMEKGFSEKIIYPYTTSQGSQIKGVLESDWKINNKEEFLKTQEWLINEGHQKEFDTLKNVIVQNGGDSADISKIDIAKLKLGSSKETISDRLKFIKEHYAEFGTSGIKAWDIARYVNLVCMGYATGYITKEEGNAMVAKILPVARAAYKDWNDYYKSYELGLKYWGEAGADETKFPILIKNMLNGDKKSIYTYLSF